MDAGATLIDKELLKQILLVAEGCWSCKNRHRDSYGGYCENFQCSRENNYEKFEPDIEWLKKEYLR